MQVTMQIIITKIIEQSLLKLKRNKSSAPQNITFKFYSRFNAIFRYLYKQ